MKINLTIIGLALLTATFFSGCEKPADINVVTKETKHHTVEITKENFDELVRNSELPVLIDFWAPWCGPCVALAPTVEELAEDYEGKIVVGKINTDEQQELGNEFDIRSIPALLFFKDGEMVKQAESRSLSGLKAEADEVIGL